MTDRVPTLEYVRRATEDIGGILVDIDVPARARAYRVAISWERDYSVTHYWGNDCVERPASELSEAERRYVERLADCMQEVDEAFERAALDERDAEMASW